ncbi:hypothetical protein ACFVFH_30085 [Streptomyces sp. NPDC057697]|uniref:hypothetical protein n=1 Tax=Streptomyces sp. NPDC057697 TaxID=3346219 RepID=UPI0036894804
MARTAHHLPPSQTRKSHDDSPGAPWHSAILNDLRYSTRSLTEAATDARRPWPQPIRRRTDVHHFARHNRDGGISRAATLAERQARQRLRARTTLLRSLVNTPAGALSLEAADTIDIPPANHRHGELWLA